MESAIKATLAQKNSEMKKLETSEKSHLRMIISSAARLKMKFCKKEDPQVPNTSAKSIRMYETHFPGFCYLRNGEYRKKTLNHKPTPTPDPIQEGILTEYFAKSTASLNGTYAANLKLYPDNNDEIRCTKKIKEIVFTNNELDVYKVMCLHLLGTQIQNKNHIQRKDGRLCSYLKAQTIGNTPQTLQPISLRINSDTYEPPTKYDKILPRYILDVSVPQQGSSMVSVKTYDCESGSEDEANKKRKLQVPIYINNEIRMIIISILEALEAVNSPKMKVISDLASSPEELRNMMMKEDVQEYITELAGNPIVTKPTSYDYIMTHVMFDKIPEKGTLETVAQVLEVSDNVNLKTSLNQIRKGITQRHSELLSTNSQRMKLGMQEKSPSNRNSIRSSNASVNSGDKYPTKPNLGEDASLKREDFSYASGIAQKENRDYTNKNRKTLKKDSSKSNKVRLDKTINDSLYFIEHNENRTNTGNFSRNLTETTDFSKFDKTILSNSQRILLGLKVASLKSKPLNMHQFEGRKKIDLGAIINPIIRPPENDINPEHISKNYLSSEKQVRTSTSRASSTQSTDLENLTRGLLANLRLEISESENKKRVTQFITEI